MKAKLKNWPRKYVAKPDGVVWVTASDEIYLSRATLYPGHAVQTSRKQSEAIKFVADSPAARDLIRVIAGMFGCRLVRLRQKKRAVVLSDKAREARRPLPPGLLAGALQDRIHIDAERCR